jgi:MFS family permease
MRSSTAFARTFAITSAVWFLVTLDRLAVMTALPAIRSDLGGDVVGAAWTVNAHTLTFAVLLLGGAALGDRFGRRRMFLLGVATYTVGAAGAALAPDLGALVAARVIEGAGAAVFAPLSLAMLTAVTPPGRRGAVLGAWGAVGGLGAALGPLVGGALVTLAGWQSVFGIDVAFGSATLVLAPWWLDAGRDPHGSAVPSPVRHLLRNRVFAVANAAALLFYAALFGAVFVVAQFLQSGLGATPLAAGLRTLPMAAMPLLLAPVGGTLADRFGTRRPMVLGAALVAAGAAGLAVVTAPGVAYPVLVVPMALLGAGSALFFAPVTAAALGAVPVPDHARAAGTVTAVREVAAALGVAALAAVVAEPGGPDPGALDPAAAILAGAAPALWPAALFAGVSALVALGLPSRPPHRQETPSCPRPSSERPSRPTTRRSAPCSSWPTAPSPTTSTPPSGAPTVPTCSTSTGTPATARCSSPWSTAPSSGPWPSIPTPPTRAWAGPPDGPAAARWRCTRATAGTESRRRCSGSWSSAPVNPAPPSSPSTPPGS